MDTSISSHTSCKMKTRNIVQVDCQVQILSVAIFLMIFEAHLKNLVHYRSEDS